MLQGFENANFKPEILKLYTLKPISLQSETPDRLLTVEFPRVLIVCPKGPGTLIADTLAPKYL